MKRIKKILAVLLAAAVSVTSLVVPAAADPTAASDDYTITLVPSKMAVEPEEEFVVNVVIGSDAESYGYAQATVTYDAEKVTYESYDTAKGLLVSKKSDGELLISMYGDEKPLTKGSAVVAALKFKAGGSEGKADLAVKDAVAGAIADPSEKTAQIMDFTDVTIADHPVAVTGITLDQTSITVNTGKYVQLKATVAPQNATNKNIIWTADDESVVKVEEDGKVRALQYGNTTVSATTEDGKYKATCNVQTRFYDVTEALVEEGTIGINEFKRTYWAANNGIVKGKKDSSGVMYFSRLTDTTRAQMAVMLYRLAKLIDPQAAAKALEKGRSTVKFTDIGNVSAGAVEGIYWAVGAGITVGYTESNGTVTYRPENSISRASTIIMLYRMAGRPAFTAATTGFTDVDGVLNPSSDTYKAIAWAKENEITQGVAQGNDTWIFDRVSNIERRQMVTFIYRYYLNVTSKG